MGLFVLFFLLAQRPNSEREPSIVVPYEFFLEQLQNDKISSVLVRENTLEFFLYGSGENYQTLAIVDNELLKLMSQHEVVPEYEAGESSGTLSIILSSIVPIAILVGVWFYFMRKYSGGQSIVQLRKSTARLLGEKTTTTFSSVGGCDQAKELLKDIVHYFQRPKEWKDAGMRLPRGILLEGPPGCGKTLLARALAGETNAHFFHVSASEFVDMFVGVGAARVRDMFEIAAAKSPAVIFIDELDAVGRRRGSGIGSAHDEREQTLNQLLVCLDGFERQEPVIVLAATNRPDVLDKALLRPGRFDRRIKIGPLNDAERLEVLKIHAKGKTLCQDVSLEALVPQTVGFNGSEIESMMNEAGLHSLRRCRHAVDERQSITASDIEEALQSMKARTRLYTKTDLVLIESASQLAQPSGETEVLIVLRDKSEVKGQVIWADAAFLKIKEAQTGRALLIPKLQILTIESLMGSEEADLSDFSKDYWNSYRPDMA